MTAVARTHDDTTPAVATSAFVSPAAHPVPDLSDVGPQAWQEANRRLLAKALSEWCFEDMLAPVALDNGSYQVELASGVHYRFRARRGAFGSWRVEPGTVTRTAAGMLGNEIAAPAEDVVTLVIDAASTLGTDPTTVATYVTELQATLAVDAARIAHGGTPVAALREAGHAEVECHMTGHPWLVANKGRVGFSSADVRAYAPESRQPVRLRWIAVVRGLAEFRGTPELSEQEVVRRELDPATVDRFTARLRDAGLAPESYVWLPVHPWQWDHAIATRFAGDIAQQRMVVLGDSPDAYLPQQSVRTMTNIDAEARYDVKLPLAIVNTLVWRGIPPHCSLGAPVVTQWLRGFLDRDPYLADECRTVFLGEVASVTVRHPYLDAVPGVPYQHRETLGCIWRESVSSRRDPDERVRTFASLLHTDGTGAAFVAELVRASGLPPEEWLTRLFTTVLDPVMHVLYRYGVTFNPHGQNTLIGFGPDDVPRRLFCKDFVDDVCVSTTFVPERGPEPDGHDHVLPRKHPSVIRQHVVDQIFVGHFRYLAPLVEAQLGVPEPRFWELVRETVLAFHRRNPELAARFAEYDLLAPTFPRYALNRDRLVVTRYGDRAERHALVPNGTVPNPLAAAQPTAAITSSETSKLA